MIELETELILLIFLIGMMAGMVFQHYWGQWTNKISLRIQDDFDSIGKVADTPKTRNGEE